MPSSRTPLNMYGIKPASQRTVNRAAMPQLPAFAFGPIYSEPVPCLDDVLLSGSDDEYYDDSDARRRRIEEQATLFLEGNRPILLSASLRGPFSKESGWENPWRGSGGGSRRKLAKHRESQAEALSAESQHAAASSQPDNAPPISPTLPASHRELGTIPGITALGDKRTQPTKRSASTDWLRRTNLKRMRPADDSDLGPSPTANRVGRSVAVGKAFKIPKTPVLARSFSAPAEPCIESAATSAATSAGQEDSSVPLEDSVSHITDSERCMSVPSDLLWGNHMEQGRENTPSIEIDETIMLDLSSSHDANVMDEAADADMASQQIATEEAQFESQRSSSQLPDRASEGPEPEENAQDASRARQQASASEKAEDERLATQFQSPWARESQWQVPPGPGSHPTTTTPTQSFPVTQNPWIEQSDPTPAMSSSQPNLPTSPCSPSQDMELPRFPSEQQQEPFLPSLPIPIPSTHSSGTVPSTPDTKQSSLPTPDMTMSIKSFKRFRSPTPTPPPRRRNNKKGGPRSILKQTRRRSEVSLGASTLSRRVQFDLPDDETGDGGNGGNDGNDCAGSGIGAEEKDFMVAGLSGTLRGRRFTCKFEAKSAKAPLRPCRRAASPPPQNRTLMESLPSEVEKFQGHYASVVGRASSTALATGTAATSFTSKASSLPIALLKGGAVGVLDSSTSTGISADSKLCDADGRDKENAWAPEIQSGSQGGNGDDAESVVDDVQEVMDNLDEFLEMWDMDAELAQVRSGRV